MANLVKLNDLWSMLEQCAPGYVKSRGEHHWIVSYAGKTFHKLPLGPHGRRKNPAVEAGTSDRSSDFSASSTARVSTSI